MPFKDSALIKPCSEDEFHLVDYKIMGIVFSIHKELGRFCDEKIYQNELAHRCYDAEFETVETEVPIQVSYKDFCKTFYMDLLINNIVMYELKTVKNLNGEHQKQALNYLLLTGMNHGKLVNMRQESVQHQFISTRLTKEKRLKFTTADWGWEDLDTDSTSLRQLVLGLVSEWGAFLDTQLYYDAINHFLGGEEQVIKRIEIVKDSRVLGTQRVHLLNPEIAFKVSAVTKTKTFYEQHLRRFLNHTSLKAIQWINFEHNKIVFSTISK